MSTEAKSPSSPSHMPPAPEDDVAEVEASNGAGEGEGRPAPARRSSPDRPPSPRRAAPPPRARTTSGLQPPPPQAVPAAAAPAPLPPPPVARSRAAEPARQPSSPPPPPLRPLTPAAGPRGVPPVLPRRSSRPPAVTDAIARQPDQEAMAEAMRAVDAATAQSMPPSADVEDDPESNSRVGLARALLRSCEQELAQNPDARRAARLHYEAAR